MKKLSLVIAAMLVVAFSVPAMAKVNLSGAMWVTYWAQEESANVMLVNGNPTNTLASPNQTVNKNSFMLARNSLGNGLQAHAANGEGIVLALDCPVNDWVSAYAEVAANDANLRPVVQEANMTLAFMPELSVQAGIIEIPFGQERNVRPAAGVEEVFISEYSQDGQGMLQVMRDPGVQVKGTVMDDMLDYNVFISNGSISSVADTAGVTGMDAAMDANDAKMTGLNLCLRPIEGLYVGGGVAAGDYALIRNDGDVGAVVTSEGQNFTAYDVNAGYDFAGVLLVSGEYAMAKHDALLPKWNQSGSEVGLNREDGRESEFILKAIYSGIDDVELGLRYGVIDPKNVASEDAAGYTSERKLTFGASYDVARNTILKAEYSMITTERGYLDSYAIGSTHDENTDPDDNILAVQLGVQF